MARLSGRTVGLDGVVDQQDNYRKSGFVLAWNGTARYEGVGGGQRPADDGDHHRCPRCRLTPLLAYDRAFFPDDAARFPALPGSHQPGASALGVLQDGQTDRLWRVAPLPQRLQDRAAVCGQPGAGRALVRGPEGAGACRARRCSWISPWPMPPRSNWCSGTA
jgi:hypothetical protein